MLSTIIQSIVKSLSVTFCLGVILADASALSGIFLGFHIVQSTQLTDPMMTVIFGSLLLYATFIDIFNQGIGLIFALCYEIEWMLRLYMMLTLTILIVRCSIVFKPPVSDLKTAPFLGRPWSDSNTPYDQMGHDIVHFYSRPASQALRSSLATFEAKLRCCGVNAPSDYSDRLDKPLSCRQDGVAVDGNATVPGDPDTNSSARLVPRSANESATTPTGGGTTIPVTAADVGGKNDTSLLRPGCRELVWALWEGSKIAFHATLSAISFTILTVLLTVAWCELWGDGLISGINWCQQKPAPKAF